MHILRHHCDINGGLQNVNENVFHGFGNLVIWRWKISGKVLKICEGFIRILNICLYESCDAIPFIFETLK